MKQHELEFWFDFASPYAYVSAMRIEEWVSAVGIRVRWVPFLLGPVFKAQGWETSPFNLYPLKGRYMWRDVERLCNRGGLSFVRPEKFPQNALLATRLAVAGSEQEWLIAFCKRLLHEEFGRGKDISGRPAIESILGEFADDASLWLERARSPETKALLHERAAEAKRKRIFGSPSFITGDDELFWGDDRLEQAIEWILKRR